MTIMTEQEINDRLIEIAKHDDFAQEQLESLEAELFSLKAIIAGVKGGQNDLRQSLKDDFLAHVNAEGDQDIHDCIEFKRRTTFQYDKKHALEFVKENDLPYTRVKIELDAVPFKKACQSGEIEYPDGETVNQPTVAIPTKLGHLLIVGQNS